MRKTLPVLLLCLVLVVYPGSRATPQGLDLLAAEDEAPVPEDAALPGWDDSLAVVGTVRLDPENRTVLARGWVNQAAGAIELFACGPGGKTHESIFVLDLNPVDLQTALLLLGLEPGPPQKGLGQGPPRGAKLDIFVDWISEGETHTRRAEEFIFNTRRKRQERKTAWVFTGSVFDEGEFKALAEQSLIVTYWDPWAIVNIGSKSGADDEILSVNKEAVPPLHTPVVIRMKAR